jgi:hypothetical protein
MRRRNGSNPRTGQRDTEEDTTMKFNPSQLATKVTFLAAAVLIAGLFAGATQAQSVYQGKFTLDQQVRWGRTLIPAGHYNLVVDSALGTASLTIARVIDTNTGVTVAMVSCPIREDAKGPSALILSRRGNQQVVHTLRLEELNESFIFVPSLAHRHLTEEARETTTVPILEANNQ